MTRGDVARAWRIPGLPNRIAGVRTTPVTVGNDTTGEAAAGPPEEEGSPFGTRRTGSSTDPLDR